MSQSIKKIATNTWDKVPFSVILVTCLIGIVFLALMWDSSNENERLLVGSSGAVSDSCDSRQNKIAARLADFLACVRISGKAKKLEFWHHQLQAARRERVFAENMGKYLEYWQGEVRNSNESSKLKTLTYTSLEDGFRRETERPNNIYSRMHQDRLSKLKDLIPGSPTWNEINSELESEMKSINKVYDDREVKMVKRFQYAQDRISRLKEIEALIEEKIRLWPRG